MLNLNPRSTKQRNKIKKSYWNLLVDTHTSYWLLSDHNYFLTRICIHYNPTS